MTTEEPTTPPGPPSPAKKPGLKSAGPALLETICSSQVIKVVTILLLTLALQVPIWMIDGTIGERQQRNNEAEKEISAKWGREQTVIGPILTIPYERDIKQTVLRNGIYEEKVVSVQLEQAHFLAEELHIQAKTDHSKRHRGIFEVPVFRLNLMIGGHFARPDFTEFDDQPDRILWDKATLTMLIADPRTITNHAVLLWNGEKIDFRPGPGNTEPGNNGIHLSLKDRLSDADRFTFETRLSLQGSRSLTFAPVAETTTATVEANWPDPSFQGNWLPAEQSVSDQGFTANWQIASLGLNFPQRWTGRGTILQRIDRSRFGVDFITPVDTYRMVERSVKYQFLFLALTFVTLWLFEVLGGLRLHPLHYLLVGAGMCLFYLLLLSLAEHLAFLTAYLTAALAIVLLLAGYCKAILGSTRRAAVVGGFIVLLYGYLYTLLINQEYALLAGSIGLFLLLAAIMFLTRKIDWRRMST